MAESSPTDYRLTGANRVVAAFSYPVIAYVILRRVMSGLGEPAFPITMGLLCIYLVLFITQPWFSRRLQWYTPFYFCIQVVIVQALGLLKPYEDTWVMLYAPLSFQLFQAYPRRIATLISSGFAFMLTVTLIYTTGWIRGVGFSLYYIVITIFFIAYIFQYSRSEMARQESQRLVDELQLAHAKLQEYANQVEELAAMQEHEQITRELQDSVSQIIFSIRLDAQSARLLAEKDPQRLPALLDRLQELTSQALSQMRSLIANLYPSQSN
jgi:signal transduction histidine kinase